MSRIRTLAACLTSTVILATAATATLAPAALATAHSPAATGSFRTWRAAQRAAGFRLLRPTRTYRLHRTGRIVVGKCEVTGKLSKREVLATYGHRSRRMLSIDQNNSGGPCGNLGQVKKLGTYRVHGVRATLLGACGPATGVSCHSRKIFLFLTWKLRHIYYVASSHDEWRWVIVGFARGLRRVS